MTIKEYIKQQTVEHICGIPFLLTGVNAGEDMDVNASTTYYAPLGFEMSFLERLRMARAEIRRDISFIQATTKAELYAYYKENIEKDNSCYWGDPFSIHPSEHLSYIRYEIRMD